ncbi:MAG: translation initiation factor IF-2 [Desulfurella sp.]|uniref:translation initiation factor IF-2 n=1 Tax=Desulfurella sp. TaxID=1962857 RepID=UPI000CB8E6E2|nr:translation initiation factor IF-2 [Desulfurella sp.]PMP92920.1 MAG: translation initiation factor IF-2 [Desulfurella sp.]
MRVYEAAKKLNIKSSVLIQRLHNLGIDVKSNFSTIPDDILDKLENKEKPQKTPEKEESQKQKKQKMEEKPKIDEKLKEKPKEKRPEFISAKKKELIEASLPQKLKGKKKHYKKPSKEEQEEQIKTIQIGKNTTVFEFASMLDVDFSEIIQKLFALGIMVRKNDIIDLDAAKIIAQDYGVEVEEKTLEKTILEETESLDDEKDLQPRPPIVTVMGHVDHGKTSILDAIRHTHVVAKESGGITQHIGAYSVNYKGKQITFLDTPGHEAFTEMRARGALLTDIVVLVVAADDGVMPQTIEAINHAKAANVPIVVAINKIDKPNANPDKVKQELSHHNIIPEEWGGENLFVNVSAKKNIGIDDLLESILLQAEIMELKANPNKRAKGIVLEAKLDKQRGPVCDVVIQEGTLNVGDSIVAGIAYGKAKVLIDDKGKRVKKATVSMPVEILGLHDVPEAGDVLFVVKDEKTAKSIAEERKEKYKASLQKKSAVSLENIFESLSSGQIKELPILIKADVFGSIEAISSSVQKISTDEVAVKIIHSGVGEITKSDVNLASVSNAIIIGFNVRPSNDALKLANDLKVEIRTYKIIYDIIEDIKKALSGLLSPTIEEEILGRIDVREVFSVPKIGNVAGCYVTYGKVTRNSKIRVIRNGVIIFEGSIASLKRFKDDVQEVVAGYECGIRIDKFNDINVGDQLESYILKEIKKTL